MPPTFPASLRAVLVRSLGKSSPQALLPGDEAIKNVQMKNPGFMKGVLYNIIPVIQMFRAIKGSPSTIITKILAEEDKIKDTKAKETKESTDVSSTEDAKDDLLQLGAGGAITVTGVGMALTTPILGLSLFVIIIGIIIITIPAIRFIIYWRKTSKIDTGKMLEIRAEMMTNNVTKLQKELAATTDPKEQARLETVIEKQKAYVTKWREKSERYLRDDDSTTYAMTTEIIETEDTSPENTGGNSNFEVVL